MAKEYIGGGNDDGIVLEGVPIGAGDLGTIVAPSGTLSSQIASKEIIRET